MTAPIPPLHYAPDWTAPTLCGAPANGAALSPGLTRCPECRAILDHAAGRWVWTGYRRSKPVYRWIRAGAVACLTQDDRLAVIPASATVPAGWTVLTGGRA